MSFSTPTPPLLRLEDLGGAATPELEAGLAVVNQFMADVCNTLAQLAAQSEPLEARRFSSPAAGNAVLTLKSPFAKVTQVEATVQRVDGAAITAAYSHTFKNLPNGQLEVQFQGLTASVDYLANLVVR